MRPARLLATLTVTLLLVTAPWAGADQAKKVPQWYLDKVAAESPVSLPRNLTPEERLLPLPVPDPLRTPPSGQVQTPSEYAPSQGMLISWEGYASILTELTVGVTTGDPEAIVYILVDNASEQASVTSTLTGAGADMSQVEFIIYSSDTVWMRDYGPRFIFEDGSRAMIDHIYNRPRPNDDAFPDFLSALWGEPQYDIPLTHGGGNFQHFDTRDAFMTDLILDENPGLTEQDVKNLFLAYENLDLTIYPGFPTSFDSTQHIDMWFLPVGDNEVIIGEYAPSTGQPYTITENAVADLQARGYTVHRTPGWNDFGTHYTYTNAVILNDLVFVSKFGGAYASQDAQALAVFQAAYVGYQVIQVDCSSIISAAGAIHCIVMQVPAYTTTMQVTPGSDLDASGPVGGPFTPASALYTVENTGDVLINYQVTKTASWLDLVNPTGSIPVGSTAQVTVAVNSLATVLGAGLYQDTVTFTNLTDHSGDTTRLARLTVGTAEQVYQFPLDSNPGWTTEGLWAFGVPTGGGGEYGNPDPTSGHTGANVYGYNLSGDYENNLPERHLTTTALDCSDLVGVEVRFWRWLGVEEPAWDHAYLRVSADGSTWTTVWQNSATMNGGAWEQQTYDISAVADGEPEVYLRWTMGTTDSAYRYCGWNIDDVEIWGIPTGEPEVPLFADGFESGDTSAWSVVVP